MPLDRVLAGANATVLDRAREFLAGLTTWEGRVAVSVALVLATVLIAVVLAPRLLRGLWRSLLGRVAGERAAQGVETVGEYAPTTLGDVAIRSLQVALLFLGGVAVLLVWGLADVARDVLLVADRSVPLLLKLTVTLGLLGGAVVGSNLLESSIARFAAEAERITEHQEEILLRVGQLALVALVVSGTLTVWGIDLSGLLVGAGFLGIVVGLAARQTLGSLIAGFVLMFSRPFTIGDWVRVGEEEGVVTDITIFNTRLETFDGEFVVLPNDLVNNAAITNRSKKGRLRIKIDVGIDYDADPERAARIAREAIAGVDLVETAPPPQVLPKAFGDSAVVLELRFWIDRPRPPRMWQATAGVVSAVKGAFEAEGIKIPFPQRELAGRAEAGGFRVRGPGVGDAAGADGPDVASDDGQDRD